MHTETMEDDQELAAVTPTFSWWWMMELNYAYLSHWEIFVWHASYV